MVFPLPERSNRINRESKAYIDFSGTINLPALSLTKDIVHKNPFTYAAYPRAFSPKLQESISKHEGIKSDSVLAGNGSSDLIWLSLQSLAPKKVLLAGPLSGEYERACQALSISYESIITSPDNAFCFDPKSLEKLWTTSADLIILSTPNNPTGVTYPNFSSIFNMLRAPRILIDNSFKEYIFGTSAYDENSYTTYKEQLRPGVSLFVLHSFSNFFACPGLRLAYLLGDYMQIRRILSARPDFVVSPYAQDIGEILLDNLDEYRATIPVLEDKLLKTSYALLQSGLFNQDYIFNGPGFVCAGLLEPKKTLSILNELKRLHISLFDCSQASNMPAGFLRVQARSDKDIAMLSEALDIVATRI